MKNTFFILVFISILPLNIYAQKWRYDDVVFSGDFIAEVYRFGYEGGRKSEDSTLFKVLCFDKNNNLTEEVDKGGLFLKFEYDSLSNYVRTLYYYEAFGNGRRAASAKESFHYENGLKNKTIRYDYVDEEWVKDDSTFTKFSFNQNIRINTEKYFDGDKSLIWTCYSNYDTTIIPSRLHFYDHLTNLYQPGVSSQISIKPNGDTLNSKLFENDINGNMTKRTFSNSRNQIERINTYAYFPNGNLREEAQYFSDGKLFFRKTYEYNGRGLIKYVRRYDGKEVLEYEEYYKYLKRK